MTGPRWVQRTTLLLASSALLALGHTAFVTPWASHWGATEAERTMPLPGDSLLPADARQETRAITIHATGATVWQWVAQLGQDRGGFYSFDQLENLVGCEMPSVDELRPALQRWQLGDRLWMYPPDKANGTGFATLRAYEPGRALVFAARSIGLSPVEPENGTWGFHVFALSDSVTRLVVRGRGVPPRPLLGRIFDGAFFGPAHFVMERRMLLGIRDLSERGRRDRVANGVQLLLWAMMVGQIASAAVRTIRRADPRRPLAGFVAAVLLFQWLTFVQPALPLGIGAVLLYFTMTRAPWRAIA